MGDNILLTINKVAQEHINKIAAKCTEIKPLVAINCITYNHEPYICEALEGFVMQKTNFPFVAIVHDDASTDGTVAIIREYADKYPDIIRPIYETEPQYSKHDGSFGRIMQEACNATGAKYVAFCEGDDYWTDPLKLQKQVDYLESHSNCSLVCSNCDKFIQNKGLMLFNNQRGKNGIITFNDLILHNGIITLTVVVRSNVYVGYSDFRMGAKVWSFGDYPIWLYAASIGYIMKFSEEMGVYRVLDKSASHFTDNISRLRWINSEFSMFDFFDSRFIIPKSVRQEALYNRCNAYGQLSISLNALDLMNRIRKFYWNNHFYIAWTSFVLMTKYPRLAFISQLIESHLAIKAPLLYLKRRWSHSNVKKLLKKTSPVYI